MNEPTWTPAPVEPEEPSPTQQWDQEMAQEEDAAPPKKRGRKVGVAVTAVIAAAAVGAGAWLVLPRLGSATAADSTLVDIREAPEETWSYRYAGRGDADWISSSITTRALGSDSVALLAPMDSAKYAESNTGGWYAGYDEHYATGYQDGLSYNEAYAAYMDDYWGSDYPDQEDYITLPGVSYSTAATDSQYAGWSDGFDDALYEYPEGTNRAERPETPPSQGRVVVVDAGSGEEEWSLDLAELDVSPDASVSLLPLSPEGHLPLTLTTYDGENYDYTVEVIALDPSDGSVVSQAEFEHATAASASGSPAPVVLAVDEGVVRLDTGDLAGDPVWSAGIGATDSVSVTNGYVSAGLEDGPWWLDAETGYEPDWFTDEGHGINYRFIDDVVLRTESSSFGYYLDALDQSGQTLWTGDAESLWVVNGSGGSALLTAEMTDESYEEFLMRLDPATGKPMWEAEYDEEFWTVTGTVDGGLVLDEGDRSVVLDLETGERSQRLRGEASHLGSSVVYGSAESRVRAWDVEDGTELWSMRLSDTEDLRRVGDMLMVHDYERRQLTRLQ